MMRGRRGTLGHVVQSLLPEVFLLEAHLTDNHMVSA